MFAFSDDLIYYSSELKPYTVDLAIGLALSLAAIDALGEAGPRAAIGRHGDWRGGRALVLVSFGICCRWLRDDLDRDALRSGRYRDAAVWGTIGTGWLASFLVCYRASSMLLSPSTTMYRFWDFAFLPLNPLSRESLAKAAGILLEIFVNPLNLVAPIWPWALG